jgi:hypothetical protein
MRKGLKADAAPHQAGAWRGRTWPAGAKEEWGRKFRMAATCLTRRMLVASPAAVLPLPRGARAQEVWPTRPVRVVVPFAAGGSTDILARLVSQLELTRFRGRPEA